MSKLKDIQLPVLKELKEFNTIFSQAMKSDVPLLNIITKYVLKQKGKQIRPLLVFLSAKLVGEVNPSTHTAASLVELLHTATLIHDDVVDNSYERRGFLSINALWKSKVAVLLGDYLLSKGLILALEKQEYNSLKIVSDAVREMAEGELLQIQKSRKLNISEEVYFKIIQKKTATLISACTACGASSTTNDEVIIQKMRDFGIKIGIAFQIKDDLLDYENTSITGKPKGNDIQEKKLTLPLIYALTKATSTERKEIIQLINKKSSSRKTFELVNSFVNKHGGTTYARSLMDSYRGAAIDILRSFEPGDSRNSLEMLVNFFIERTN